MIEVKKDIEVTISGTDIEVLGNLLEMARRKLAGGNKPLDYTDDQYYAMRALLSCLFEAIS